jgi:RNA polymerase sigma-70 factor (ECF subfamily)
MMFPLAPAPGIITGIRPSTQFPDALLSEDDRTGLRVLYHDPLDTLEVTEGAGVIAGPSQELERSQSLGLIEEGLKRLPARQREAFLLRYWEDLDVQETAAAMGCSEGSVKTHCSRAAHALAEFLGARGIEP